MSQHGGVTGPAIAPLRAVQSLRTRLLLGLAIATALPLLLFGWLGGQELRRSTRDNLIVHLVQGLARRGAERLDAWFTRTERAARLVVAAGELQAAFEGPQGRERFERWFLQAGPEVRSLGDLLLAERGPDGDWRLILRTRAEHPGTLGGELPASVRELLQEAESRDEARFFAPRTEEFSERTTLSHPRDPAGYVLPYALPLRRPNQLPLGVVLFFLPFEDVQHAVAAAEGVLAEDWGLDSGAAFLMDQGAGRFLLHSDRSRIGEMPAASTEQVIKLEALAAERELPWAFGVSADERELFRSVDQLGASFLGLLVLVLLLTLGIAAVLLVAATRSLRELESFAQEIGAGRLEARAGPTGPREVRALGNALNTMAEQLAEDRERRRVAEREAAWTKMARQVAHEIKNPLQPVRLQGELLYRELSRAELEEELRHKLLRSNEVILRQVDALQRIVADFSQFASAGLPAKTHERFQAAAVLHEVEQLYSAIDDDGVRVEFDIEEDAREAWLLGSPLRLQQILVNLVKNAVEASAAQPGAQRVLLRASVTDEGWCAEVLDDGPGLPEDGEQLFEPYFSTKKGGTGLGLAISRRSAEAMGGSLSLNARAVAGCIAELRLPLAAR